MSWSRRRTLRAGLFGLAALPLLGGCSFSPVYATGSRASDLNGKITVVAPEGASPFILGRFLEDSLGPPTDPQYVLSFTLELDTESIAITATQDINRYNITAVADWKLTRTADGTVPYSGSVDSFTSFSATGTPVATRAAERDALDRLMQILSDKILAELLTGAEA